VLSGADRPAPLLAWILVLTCAHARSMSSEQELARLGWVESVTAAALRISSSRNSMIRILKGAMYHRLIASIWRPRNEDS
jgi:hypothetical protein